jgi:heat shock protein HslJ
MKKYLPEIIFFCAFLAAVLFVSCSSLPISFGSEQRLESGQWVLDSIDGGKVILPSGVQITLSFDNGTGKAYGSGVCNNYFANYMVDGQRINISRLGSTKEACTGDSLERFYLNNLLRVDEYFVSHKRLYLVILEKKAFVFSAKE